VDFEHVLFVIFHFGMVNVDSNFNLPPNVTIEYDVNSANNVNLQPLSSNNNPQAGGLAPEAFQDVNLDTIPDPLAVSGYVFLYLFHTDFVFRPVWALADGSIVC
jgi:hypothetical protein